MSKHNKNTQLSAPQGQPAGEQQSTPVPAVDGKPADAGIPRKYFFIFWGLIVLAVALAWTLEVLMPNVAESVIERWIMLGLSGALGAFLLANFR